MQKPTSFGNRVRQRRRQLGMSQEELAARIAVSSSLIRKIESDLRRPSPQIAELLADALALPATERQLFLQSARPDLWTDPQPPVEESHPPEPPSPPSSPRPAELPIPPTPLVGRTTELSQILHTLADPACRLLTLTGMGGIGKTRLAIQAAHSIVDYATLGAESEAIKTDKFPQFKDGVYFVTLIPVNSIDLIIPAIAHVLGLTLADVNPKALLFEFLQSKNVLLILDNCEHLLDGVDLLAELLEQAPGLKLLATSREQLQLVGEWVFEVQGLPVAPLTGPIASDTPQSSAVALFLQSARRVRVKFALSAENQAAVILICQLVEGMPLALELAASWVHTLAPEEIALEIERQFDFLTQKTRGISERHRSIRAVFDYSWQLLSGEERRVLRQLGIFRGDFSREAATQVTGAPLHLLSGLIAKSLVQRSENGRFQLHELVRQYAAEQLHNAGEETLLHRRHAEYFMAFADRVEPLSYLDNSGVGRTQLDLELNNLRSALHWSLQEQGDPQIGLAVAGAMGHYWYVRELWREGREWLEQALAHPGPPLFMRARAELGLGTLLMALGELRAAVRQLSTALATFRTLDRRWYVAWTLHMLALAYGFLFEPEHTVQAANESLDLFRALGDRGGVAMALERLGDSALTRSEFGRTVELMEEGLAIQRELGRAGGIAAALNLLGMAAHGQGNHEQALAYFEESLPIFRQRNVKGGSAWVLHNLAQTSLAVGEFAQATLYLREAVRFHQELGAQDGIAWDLEWFGCIAAAKAEPVRAARLMGHAAALREAVGIPGHTFEPEYRHYQSTAEALLVQQRWHAAWREGQSMSLEQIVAYALAEAEDTLPIIFDLPQKF